MKKVVILLLTMLLCIGLAGCGEDKQTLTNEKGDILKYEINEVTENGFYVYDTKEELFTPIMNASDGYQGVTTEYDPYRYLWFGKSEYDFEKLIPKVDGERYVLTLIQTYEEDMPETYILERYKKLGYTLGVKFSFGGTGNKLFLDGGATCSTSMASTELGEGNGYLPVYSINGSTSLPLDNIDTDIEMLLGLEEGKKYDIEYFDGTRLKERTLLADTVVYKAKQLLELDDPLEVTTNGYFIVKLPLNLKAGYYYINDGGLFKYVPKDKPVEQKEVTESKEESVTKEKDDETKQETEPAADSSSDTEVIEEDTTEDSGSADQDTFEASDDEEEDSDSAPAEGQLLGN